MKVTIVGAGAWGTALAMVLRRAGHETLIWARTPAIAETINRQHENPLYLPGLRLEPTIRATAEIAALGGSDVVLLVTPAQHLGTVAASLASHVADTTPLIIGAKGIERQTGKLMTEVVAEALPGRPLAVLSGPTFAAEVARGLPTAVTLACKDATLGAHLLNAIGTPAFRPYLSDDPLGAQIGGAVKNVLAIACGICVGRRLGDNARAALMTRGLAEILRLGRALGAEPATLMGLSGLGDLTLTCNSAQSRNMSLGIALGEGRPLAEIMAGRHSVAEGMFSAGAVVALAERCSVETPISAAVDAIVTRSAAIDSTIAALLDRPFTQEATRLHA